MHETVNIYYQFLTTVFMGHVLSILRKPNQSSYPKLVKKCNLSG